MFWPSGPPYFHVLSIAKYLLLLLHLARCRWRRFFRCLKLPSQTRCWCRRDSLCSPRTPKTCGTECFIFAKHTGISSTWTKKLRIMERVHYIHSLFMDPSRDGCTCCCTSCCRRFLGWWSSTLCQTPRILWVLLSCLLTGKGHFTRRKKNQDYCVVLTGCDEHFGYFCSVHTRYGSLEDVWVHLNQAPPELIHTDTRRTWERKKISDILITIMH